MGRVNTPLLDEKAKAELDKRFRTDKRHAVRMRCQLVLLKAEGRKSKEVASIVNMCEMSVNNWLNRYKTDGIAGLLTKPGRGRKAVIFSEQEQQNALALIKANRQKLQTAKAEWESQQGKSIGRDAFRRFLKAMVDDTNGFVSE
ncbi:helix-turn-helix domain-containing protein [Larkinella sp. GY13]|uniref:helix-turn-helix domain-containing protein n=1 Tax=Larkinella sp. GY13 TaxID=3453720 RepID=UPI003EE8FF88